MGRHQGRMAIVAGLVLWVVLAPSTAAADGPEEEAAPGPYVLTLRGTGGLGAGSSFGPRLGLAGEVWLLENVGVGGFFGAAFSFTDASTQQSYAVPNTTASQSTTFAGGSLALRTAGRGSYGFVSLGAGSAWGQTKYAASCTTSASSTSLCTPTPATSFASDLFDVTVAWFWHPWGVEIGPSLSVDVMNGGVLASASLALGVALDAPRSTPKQAIVSP